MQYSDVVSVGGIAIVIIVGLLSFAVFFCRRSVSWVAHARKKTVLSIKFMHALLLSVRFGHCSQDFSRIRRVLLRWFT